MPVPNDDTSIPNDDRPVVRLSLVEQISWLRFVQKETHRHPGRLLNYWIRRRGPIQEPVLDATFRSLWKMPTENERQQDHG